jgi:hypothetical protein
MPSIVAASSASSSFKGGGLTFHTRTRPSRLPVATRWYERPQDGAHATDVTEYVGGLARCVGEEVGGDGSSVSTATGLREGESLTIWRLCEVAKLSSVQIMSP